ncbi:hypothetical protein [Mucilaginibacter jinjuensis]|uniref:Uncharacterized protein n=1 Tax=Mucilaginibacter jinjuensis TaxID=1176721 RepID=A0ABY7TFK7_9SPHI|nr:hypothetical protein [Mucilaginibacter jinjuensis]WCT14513.1 hypothetical protein PQO05_11270 [Mucilaginibacter jinjuensis]
MKAPIFTILLLGTLLSANAQVKSDTAKVAAQSTAKVSAKADTVGCWFKELRRTRYSYGWFRSTKDSTLREVWQHGYMVKGSTVVYLYSDKKTKVKNRIVDSFEHGSPAMAANVK